MTGFPSGGARFAYPPGGGGAGTITEIQGTENQVIVTDGTGPIVGLATPQDIGLTSNPEFAGVRFRGDGSTSINLLGPQSGEDFDRILPNTKGSNGQFLMTQGTSSDQLIWSTPVIGGSVSVLYQSVEEPQNVDTDETDMYSYLIPMDTLSQDGDRLRVTLGFRITSATLITFRGRYNGVTVLDTEASDFDGGSGSLSIIMMIVRKTNDQVMSHTSWNFKNGSMISKADTAKASSQNFSGQDNLLVITAQGGASNQCVGTGFVIEKLTAPVVP